VVESWLENACRTARIDPEKKECLVEQGPSFQTCDTSPLISPLTAPMTARGGACGGPAKAHRVAPNTGPLLPLFVSASETAAVTCDKPQWNLDLLAIVARWTFRELTSGQSGNHIKSPHCMRPVESSGCKAHEGGIDFKNIAIDFFRHE